MKFEVKSNVPLTKSVFEMVLLGDTASITKPGQFVQIALDGFYLRRPISVCDWESGALTIIYKVVGRGTERMATIAPGSELDLLTGLGNGYDMDDSGENPLLIGGGVGVPPLYALCKLLIQKGVKPSVILGFNTADEVFLLGRFEKLGAPTILTTVDGTAGEKGFVTAPMGRMDYSAFYACGPEPMLKAVAHATKTDGQLSFEQRMACGFGACMGCSCQTKYGARRICKDGPVLYKEEVVW